jgi:hypothetical protein
MGAIRLAYIFPPSPFTFWPFSARFALLAACFMLVSQSSYPSTLKVERYDQPKRLIRRYK